MESNFQLYSNYYDLLYSNKNYDAETTYLQKIVNYYRPHASSMLELGCGTGNHAQFLCSKGFIVTGLERSEKMVNLALKKNIQGFSPLVKDITDFTLSQKFDIAISLFHVVSYLNQNTALISCLSAVQKHLNPEGLFIFDVWYSPAVYRQTPQTRIKRLEDEKTVVTRLAEPITHVNSNVVDVNYEIILRDKTTGHTEIFTEIHPMRHFSTPEIELLAIHTGFKLIKSEEFLTGNNPGEDTWGVCYILQKV